jgi:hypothetical protein
MKRYIRALPLVALLGGVLIAQGPAPVVNIPLVPSSVEPGGGDFVLTVNGSGFSPASVADWNASPLPTTFISETQLVAAVSANQISRAHSVSITVDNGFGPLSNEVPFLVATRTQNPRFVDLTVPGFAVKNFAAGDFNNDGLQDIASWDKNRIEVLLANGDGTFRGPVASSCWPGYTLVSVADFNGDHIPDLVFTTFPFVGVSICKGNGDGSFTPLGLVPLPNGSYGFASGDFNGDGKLDLALTIFNYNATTTVAMLFGNGEGMFQLGQQEFDTGSYYFGSNTVAADFNGDGVLDLAFADIYSSTINVLLNDGTGNFGSPVISPTIYEIYPTLVPADLNGDSRLDLVAGHNFGTAMLTFLGNGDGSFTFGGGAGTDGDPYRYVVGDFNNDGRLDVEVNTSGYSAAPRLSFLQGTGDGSLSLSSVLGLKFKSNGIAMADYNNDGRLDVSVVDLMNGSVHLLLQEPATSEALNTRH